MLGALLLMSLVFVGCKKNKIKTYNLTFTATHGVTQENQFCTPYATYWWTIMDADYKYTYEVYSTVIRQTVTGTATAKTGDFILINVGVNDVFDYGSVTCESSDGTVLLAAYTDNLYNSDGDNVTLKSMHTQTRDGKDTTIQVKQIKFQLK